MVTVASLAREWREEAERLRHRGLEREAAMAESYADDLERRINAEAVATVSISEAAEMSGYSVSALYDMVKRDRIENVGTPGAIRIRRADLPKKPPPTAKHGEPEPDLVSGLKRLRIS